MLPYPVSRQNDLKLWPMCGRRARLLALLVAGGTICGATASAAQAQTTVKLYRYAVLTDTDDTDYRSEITPGATPKGGYFKVERDTVGRILRVTGLRNGQETNVTTYHYIGRNWASDSSETFEYGEKTQISLYQRDPQGHITREDDETADGKLTGYSLLTWTPSHADVLGYDPSNRLIRHYSMDFSPAGVHVHRITYSSPTSTASYVERETDEHTGLSVSARQFSDGKLDNTRKFTYDGNGDETRMDIYGPDGVWYAASEYTDSLLSRKLYKMSNGVSWELDYSYDGKKWLKQTDIVVAGKPLCKLTYDMESDGTVKRTLAIGTDGTLWAEYPAPIVRDIQQNGQPPGRTDGILHKTGNWW
jgi:hypothetical protein